MSVDLARGRRSGAEMIARSLRVERCIGIDWSGAKTTSQQRRKIWVAEADVETKEIVRLESRMTREEVVDALLERTDEPIVVGFDFAFSAPAWWLAELGCAAASGLWERSEREAASWLEPTAPFWAKKGTMNRALGGRPCRRQCEPDSAESVFKLVGPRQVGRGSIRGWPLLRKMQENGFSIWPFDAVHLPMVIEIFPRALMGLSVKKTDKESRCQYLAGPDFKMPRAIRDSAVSTDDAFDATVSAMALARHVSDLIDNRFTPREIDRVEGKIWVPDPKMS